MSVDRLVTDAQCAGLFAHPGDLLGAEPSAQQSRHPRHVGRTEVRAAATAATPGRRVAVRFLGPVVAVVVGRVASQLPTDRAGVALQQTRDPDLRNSAHPMRGDPVSFFLGELVVRFHGCNPVPGRMRRRSVSPLPTFLQEVGHLLCESATPNPAVERTRRFSASTWPMSTRRAAHLAR